jgi:CDP-diacylglycerol--inositol 3-phosphatidyltransferase
LSRISSVRVLLLLFAVAHVSPGYTRVILVGISLHYMGSHPNTCTLLYGVSALLDAVDGQAARALGQTSRFGAVLDMVTDR